MVRRLQIAPRCECRVIDNSLASFGPHVRNIKVRPSVAVIVKPRSAHSGPDVFYPGFSGLVAKLAVAISVEVTFSKIISHVEVRPAVAVEVAPRRCEAVAIVVMVEARLVGNVFKIPC